VSERRLRTLEWAALDADTRRQWGGFLRQRGVPVAAGLAEIRRSVLLDGLGLWPRYEQDLAARAGCSVAEMRRRLRRVTAGDDGAKPADSAEPGLPGGPTHAV
jgi:hypothetical protein